MFVANFETGGRRRRRRRRRFVVPRPGATLSHLVKTRKDIWCVKKRLWNFESTKYKALGNPGVSSFYGAVGN
jgi:hypothetical protein